MPSSLLRRTPFGLVSLVVSSFPGPGSCPRDASLRPKSTGSASALPFSKLAQRSLSLRPDHSLSCSHSPFLQCLIDFVSSINPPGGSGWSVSSRVGFLISLPLEIHGFSRHTDRCRLATLSYVSSCFGNLDSTLNPLSVTTPSSSIRAPPTPGRYSPGSTVKTWPGLNSVFAIRGSSWISSPSP